MAGTITSSPLDTPDARNASARASVPDPHTAPARHAVQRRERRLECLDLGTAIELARLEHACERGIELVAIDAWSAPRSANRMRVIDMQLLQMLQTSASCAR